MVARPLVRRMNHDTQPRPLAPPAGRPALLLVGNGDDTTMEWARHGIERRYRLTAQPAGARGVISFDEAGLSRALACALHAGLPVAALRTATLGRAARRPGAAGAPGSPGIVLDSALPALVVSAVHDSVPVPLFAARPERDAAPGADAGPDIGADAGPGIGADTGYVVEAADPLLARTDVIGAVYAAHREHGIRGGVTVTELRVAGGPGRPVDIVGLGGLLPADPLLRAGTLATGVDCALVWADLTIDAAPDLTPRRRGAAAVRRITLDRATSRAEVDIRALPGGIWEVHPHPDLSGEVHGHPGPPGDLPGSRPASAVLAVAVGEDAAACRRALDLLPAALSVEQHL